MTDNYPTRILKDGFFMPRTEKVSYTCEFPDYEENGYKIFKNYFSRNEIEEILTTNIGGLVTNEPGSEKVVRSKTGIHLTNQLCNELACSGSLPQMVKEILGSDIYIHQSRVNYKLPFVGTGWHWHSDFETWHAQDGMPAMNCLTAMIPLTVNHKHNGSLLVIPKSHKIFYACPSTGATHDAMSNFADQKEGLPDEAAIKFFLKESEIVSIECEPGDLVLFDCNIIHGSVANMSPEPRTNLFFVYNSVNNKLVAPFNGQEPRPEEMGARLNTQTI